MKNILASSLLLMTFLITTTFSSFALSLVAGSGEEDFNTVSSRRVGCFMFVSNLKFGDGIKNVDLTLVKFGSESKIYKVIELQNALINAGYLSGNATGYFGVNTLKAVKKYQKANGISPTGFVGLKTQGILRSQFCNVSVIDTKPPVCDYAAPPTGCSYVQGSDYSSITQCGMILKCDVLPGSDNKIKDCPTEKIINQMPVMCVRAPCPAIDNSYYIYKGTRKEISDFDTNYVKNNCKVTETVVM